MLGVGVVEGTARVDTGGGREGGSLIDDVGEELTVDGIGDRTTDLNVGEILVGEVELEPLDRADRGVTVSGDDHVLVVLQADDVGGAVGRAGRCRRSPGRGRWSPGQGRSR